MAFILSKIKLFHNKVKPEQDDQLIIVVEEYLPEELAIDDIDHTLYDIGLVLTSREDVVKKRSVVNHPIIVFTVIFIFVLFRIIIIILGQSYGLAVVLGDIDFFIGVNNRFNIYQV